MDIPALFGKKSDDAAGVPPVIATPTDDSTADNAAIDTNNIIPNETIEPNDLSLIGETAKPVPPVINDVSEPDLSSLPFAPHTKPQTKPESKVVTLPQPKSDGSDDLSSVAVTPSPEPKDPAKTDFIKTYTQDFDDTLDRATTAAQKVLDSIDAAIKDKSSDITVPEEAKEFIDNPPEDGKVQKFEDARVIVRTIMQRATEAKQQSEAAAAEAAKVYDEVQAFKKETKEQIKNLVGDEAKKHKANKPDDSDSHNNF